MYKHLFSALIITAVVIVLYEAGYYAGKNASLVKCQKETIQAVSEVGHTHIVVQKEMEKADEKVEKAKSISDECRYVLDYDLTPCGVLE